MAESPTLLIIFNRPDSTEKVFEAIRLCRPKKLYIAADAPRKNNAEDEKKCHAARTATEYIDWPCDVKRLYQERNLGCGLGVRDALAWFFSCEKEGIILEDDCVPHIDFFSFASNMLDRYRENKEIISVNGSNLGYILKDGNSYTFSRFMNMWGWATWADRANAVDYSMTNWKKIKNPISFLHIRMRQNFFDYDFNWYKYWQQKFDLVSKDEKFTWDWQWIYHQLENEQLSVIPSRNLVSNIGFNDDATHTHKGDNPSSNIETYSIEFPLVHPRKIAIDYDYEEKFVKWIWCYYKRLPFAFYFKQMISNLVRRPREKKA